MRDATAAATFYTDRSIPFVLFDRSFGFEFRERNFHFFGGHLDARIFSRGPQRTIRVDRYRGYRPAWRLQLPVNYLRFEECVVWM
jgi:hypothetical protein